MIKKLFILFVSIFILSGCTSNMKKEIVTFSTWGSVTEINVIKKIITDFEKENPNIQIELLHIPQNYFQKLQLLFASNTEPDIVFINNLYLPIYASRLCDLSSFVDSREFYQQSLDGLSSNGKLLAIPRDISILLFYVNTDIISPPNYNWELEDLLKLSQKATKNGVYGISFEEDIYWTLPYLSYYNEVFNAEFNSNTSKGLKFYLDMRDKYKAAPTKAETGSSTLAQMFLDKKIGLYLSGRWMYPKIQETAEFNWIVMPFPKGKGSYPCDTAGWAISNNSKHKDTALEFIKYLSGEKGTKYFMETGLIVPARIEVSKSLNNKMHNEKAFLEVIKNSKSTVVTKNYKKLSDKFHKEVY